VTAPGARAAGTVVLALTVAAAACGVPGDAQPRALPTDDVPFELLAPDTTEAPTSVLVAVSAEVPIYLVGAEGLVAVKRLVEAPPSLLRVIEALLAGPNADEAAAGMRSAIASGTRVHSVRTQSGVATVDLSAEFGSIVGLDQILAVGQLVLTTTEALGVVGVKLSLDGRALEVPRGDGTLTSEPLRPSDFAVFAPS